MVVDVSATSNAGVSQAARGVFKRCVTLAALKLTHFEHSRLILLRFIYLSDKSRQLAYPALGR